MARWLCNILLALSRPGRARRTPDTAGHDGCAGLPGRRVTPRRLFVLAVLFLGFGPSLSVSHAAGPSEYEVKAVLISKFALFIEWPEDTFGGPKAPFVIAVVGPDPFRGALEAAVEGKSVNGRRVVVRHFADAESITPCQILFVGPSDHHDLPQVLDRAGKGTLTVADFDEFTAEGGMFRFFRDGTKIGFEVNLRAVQRSRLKISAKLLKLAKVYDE